MSETEITDAIRAYLHALARGDRSIAAWRAWCDANRDGLSALHGRAGFLKLKFEPAGTVPAWLASLGIELAVAGRVMLRKAARGTGWDDTPDVFGVRALYAKGKHEKADSKLRALVVQTLEEGRVARDGFLGLADLAVDAEALLEDGFVDEARGLATALGALDAEDDLLWPIVEHARETLAAIELRAPR